MKVQSYHAEPIIARKVVLEFSRETEPRRKKEKGKEGVRERGRKEGCSLFFFSCSFTKHYVELFIKTWLTMMVESDKFHDLWLAKWGPRRAHDVSSNPKASREGQDLGRADFPVPLQRQEED